MFSKHYQVCFPDLFQVGWIGNVRVRNRIVMAPMGMHYNAGINGEVTDRTIAFFEQRAKGGAGLIIAGITDPMPTLQRVTVPFLSLGQDKLTRGHTYLVEAVKAYGANMGIQLGHVGSQISIVAHGGRVPISPSGISTCFVDGHPYCEPRPMTNDEIYDVIECFAAAACRAKDAGYDMVEIHGGHGYLVSSFMSEATNKREDEFGGSLENRMRFALEIIKRIKQVCGQDYPVGIRISADEFVEGGITLKESPTMAKMLEESGATVINVSVGTGETLHLVNDMMRVKEGWRRPFWEKIKEAVTIPVIGAGTNRTPELCEKLISEGILDFVGLGRPFLADPEWPNKVMEGRVEDIRPCVSCMGCIYRSGGVPYPAPRCSVNALNGRERDWPEITASPIKKKVMIVGGGVAGMEAARVASLRGHDVTLYEKENELGGQLSLAGTPPGKEKWLWFRDYLISQLKKQNVKIKLAVLVNPELVEKERADTVVIATGGKSLIPEISGVKALQEKRKLMTAWEVLESDLMINDSKVVIIGGGMIGCETAEFLAEKGNEVTIIEILTKAAKDMEPHNRRGLLDALKEYQVKIFTEMEIEEVRGNGVFAIDKRTGENRFIESEAIILALGTESVRELAEALEERRIEHVTIGDCRQARSVMDSVYEGALIGRQI